MFGPGCWLLPGHGIHRRSSANLHARGAGFLLACRHSSESRLTAAPALSPRNGGLQEKALCIRVAGANAFGGIVETPRNPRHAPFHVRRSNININIEISIVINITVI